MRANQLATLPFARSGRAEAVLYDKYPELLERIERGRRAKIDAIVLSNKYSEADALTSTSFRAQSLEELSSSPLRQRTRRRVSKEHKTAESPSATPLLQGKASVSDMIFEMSDGDEAEDEKKDHILPPRFTSSTSEKYARDTPVGSPEAPWSDFGRTGPTTSHAAASQVNAASSALSFGAQTAEERRDRRNPSQPWGAAPSPLSGTKLGLKDIMSQAWLDKPSNLTLGLSQQDVEEKHSGSFQVKLSQRERKRLQQAQDLGHPTHIEKTQPAPPAVSPWQAMSQRKLTPSRSPVPAPKPSPKPSRTSSTPQLTLRQTISNNGTTSKQKESSRPLENDKQRERSSPAQPSRNASSSTHLLTRPSSGPSGPGMSVSTAPIATPQSVRHIPLPSHSPTSPSQHLSMNEILSLQEAEKSYIKDAASKRSLQEIQQEQEFQEWWDQESKRMMQEEEQRKRAEERTLGSSRGRSKARSARGKGKGKKDNEGGERGKGSRDVSVAPGSHDASTAKPASKPDANEKPKEKGRNPRGGRGRGGRGGRSQGSVRDGPVSEAPLAK